eukprot:COSAG02_NODE_1714_length_11220_cov_3.198543_15_plen_36_part_00
MAAMEYDADTTTKARNIAEGDAQLAMNKLPSDRFL